MQSKSPLSRSFYNRPSLLVARELLGCQLVHIDQGRRIAGLIVETEAYCGEQDLGCHAKAGRTKRTEAMYGPPGHAYVYFTYGNHWMFCAVTMPEGSPEAVLVRALIPTDGLDLISQRRSPQAKAKWTDGPGKLCQAFGINGQHKQEDLTSNEAPLWIEPGLKIPDPFVTTSPRIGLYSVPEPWKSKAWRYLARLPEAWLSSQLDEVLQ